MKCYPSWCNPSHNINDGWTSNKGNPIRSTVLKCVRYRKFKTADLIAFRNSFFMARDENSSFPWSYVSARVGTLRVSEVEFHIITGSESTTSEKAGSEGKIANI